MIKSTIRCFNLLKQHKKLLIIFMFYPVLLAGEALALECHNLPAKEISSGEYVGTNGVDVIVITQKDALVDTGGGNDAVCVSGALKVKVKLGSGDDYFRGGSGEDRVIGGSGDDTISGKNGDDFLMGGEGDDYISGAEGDDTIWGDDDNKILEKGGDDTLKGGEGNDRIFGGDYADEIYGEDGNDSIWGEWKDMSLKPASHCLKKLGKGFVISSVSDQGPFTQTIYFSSDAIFIEEKNNVCYFEGEISESIYTGNNATPFITVLGKQKKGMPKMWTNGDDINGGLGDDVIKGGDGSDEISGSYGVDIIEGNDGNDRLNGGNDEDLILGQNGGDMIQGGDGDDRLYGCSSTGSCSDDNNTIKGGDGDDYVMDGNGADFIYGDNGDDFLEALGSGLDRVYGGDGYDRLSGYDDDILFAEGDGGSCIVLGSLPFLPSFCDD